MEEIVITAVALDARRLGQSAAAGRRQPHGEETDQAGDEHEYEKRYG